MGARLSFKVNNGGTLSLIQKDSDRAVSVEVSRTGLSSKIVSIPPNDFVMLLNYYKYVKENDIQNDFINYCGANDEVSIKKLSRGEIER